MRLERGLLEFTDRCITMRDASVITTDAEVVQFGLSARRHLLFAVLFVGVAFVAPLSLNGQARAEPSDRALSTREAIAIVGKTYEVDSLVEWAAAADSDDLETVLDAAQLLQSARFIAFLDEEFDLSVTANTASQLVIDLRYYKRFRVIPPRVNRDRLILAGDDYKNG